MIDGVAAMKRFQQLHRHELDICKVPVMVDLSKSDVIEAGWCAGKANSSFIHQGRRRGILRWGDFVLRYGEGAVVQ